VCNKNQEKKALQRGLPDIPADNAQLAASAKLAAESMLRRP
jgi:hypothetical protein